ncbi:MAG: MBL fold metallo-hydrolase, partial [Planctomycetota bacterium]
MQFRVLGSGSRGNASLLWAGDRLLLVDAGLTIRSLNERLDEARVGFRGIDHVVVTHGHLDHARSAGIVAKRHGAVLHCADTIRQHRALSRAPEHASLTAGEPHRIDGGGSGEITIDALRVPHDCDPTFALRFESDGRALALVTDMGEPRDDVAKAFTDAHVVVVEANHDPGMLARGPYPDALKARVAG